MSTLALPSGDDPMSSISQENVGEKKYSNDKNCHRPTANDVNPPRTQTIREALPLDWTRVSKKRARTSVIAAVTGEDSKNDDVCCNDTPCTQTREPTHLDPESATTLSCTTLEGKAIFCLPTPNCEWFQGQFLPLPNERKRTTKPMGLLATNRSNVDECLRCVDGGYRELNVTLYSSSSSASNSKKFTWERVLCTGGDLLQMNTETNDDADCSTCMTFAAQTIVTGRGQAHSLMNRFFPSLLRRATTPPTESTSSIRDTLPDCAIIIGDMNMTIPTKFVAVTVPTMTSNDDGWRGDESLFFFGREST